MSRTLFLGDSHTCGYDSVPDKVGIGSFSLWQENNYADLYHYDTNRDVVVYAMPGACNSSYTDWLTASLQKYNDIDEVFILLSSFNRFVIGANKTLSNDVVPVDHFTTKLESPKGIDRYIDDIVVGDYFQLYQKPNMYDYEKFPRLSFTEEDGLIEPDLRKASFMEIKTWFDLNTHIEQRQFFKDVYMWDKICQEHKCKLYLFYMTDRLQFPDSLDYYGKLNVTHYEKASVESFFRRKNIDHTRYFTTDGEHYNKDYHQLVAEKFLPYLKNNA